MLQRGGCRFIHLRCKGQVILMIKIKIIYDIYEAYQFFSITSESMYFFLSHRNI